MYILSFYDYRPACRIVVGGTVLYVKVIKKQVDFLRAEN